MGGKHIFAQWDMQLFGVLQPLAICRSTKAKGRGMKWETTRHANIGVVKEVLRDAETHRTPECGCVMSMQRPASVFCCIKLHPTVNAKQCLIPCKDFLDRATYCQDSGGKDREGLLASD